MLAWPAHGWQFWVLATVLAVGIVAVARHAPRERRRRVGLVLLGAHAAALAITVAAPAMVLRLMGDSRRWADGDTLRLAAGVALVAGATLAAWAMLWDRSGGRRRCPRCWYDMGGTPGLVCPECGRDARRERRLLKTRPRKGWTALGLSIVMAGSAALAFPSLKDVDWRQHVPTTAYLGALPWMDPDGAAAEVLLDRFLAHQERMGPPIRGWQRRLAMRRCRGILEAEGSTAQQRRYALVLAATLGTEAAAFADAAQRLTGERDQRVRAAAAWCLVRVSADRVAAVRAVAPLLSDPSPLVRSAVVGVLARPRDEPFDMDAPAGLASLARSGADRHAQALALRALARFRATPEAVGAAVTAVNLADIRVTQEALRALALLDPSNEGLAPGFRRALGSADPWVAAQALQLLVELAGEPADGSERARVARRIVLTPECAQAAAAALPVAAPIAATQSVLSLMGSSREALPWCRQFLSAALADPAARAVVVKSLEWEPAPSARRETLRSLLLSLPDDHAGRAEVLDALERTPRAEPSR